MQENKHTCKERNDSFQHKHRKTENGQGTNRQPRYMYLARGFDVSPLAVGSTHFSLPLIEESHSRHVLSLLEVMICRCGHKKNESEQVSVCLYEDQKGAKTKMYQIAIWVPVEVIDRLLVALTLVDFLHLLASNLPYSQLAIVAAGCDEFGLGIEFAAVLRTQKE